MKSCISAGIRTKRKGKWGIFYDIQRTDKPSILARGGDVMGTMENEEVKMSFNVPGLTYTPE